MTTRRSFRSLKFAGLVAFLAAIVGLAFWSLPADPLARGARAYGRGDWRSAEMQARSALKLNSDDRRALRLLARAAARQGNDSSAEAIFRRLGTGPMEAEDYFLLGRGLLNRGQTGPALASLGAARDMTPDHAETLDALSRYWATARMMTDALDAAERLAQQPGWEVRGRVRSGVLRSELFDPLGAATLLADALARDPELNAADLRPAAARRLLTRSWLRAGRPAVARAVLDDSPSRALDPEGYWLLSRAFLQEGKLDHAATALTQAGGFSPADPLAHEPAPYLGAARCASCHRAQYQSQQSSRHARTLLRTAELPAIAWPREKIDDPHNRRADHQFSRTADEIDVVTTIENQTFRAVLQFAMGSNHQGQSFLAREPGGQIRELRISHYPTAPEWGRTMEHPEEPPDAPGYIGRPISSESFRKCIHCHSTNFRAVLEPGQGAVAQDRGIGCERCHGPAGNHVAAVGASFPELAIAVPRLAPAARIVALCGECHTAPSKTNPQDRSFVRYQASGLVLSRCYVESRQSLSCTTCHDPHKDTETRSNFYESVCLQCHGTTKPVPTTGAPDSSKGAICSVNSQHGCLDCHMPRIKNAVPRTVFTDHQIRIKSD